MEPKQILGMGEKTNSIGNQTKSIGNKSKSISNKKNGKSNKSKGNQTKSIGKSNKSKSKGISNKSKGISNKKNGISNKSKSISNQSKSISNQTKSKSKKINRSLVGNMPDFNNASSEIKMSKQGLRKILKVITSSSKPYVMSQNHMFCQVLQFAFSIKNENHEKISSQT